MAALDPPPQKTFPGLAPAQTSATVLAAVPNPGRPGYEPAYVKDQTVTINAIEVPNVAPQQGQAQPGEEEQGVDGHGEDAAAPGQIRQEEDQGTHLQPAVMPAKVPAQHFHQGRSHQWAP